MKKKSRLKNIKAVLFDVDGTLLDIRKIYVKSMNDALGFYGLKKIRNEKILKLRQNGKNALEIMATHIGKNKKLNLIEDRREKLVTDRTYLNLGRPFKKSKSTLKQLKSLKKKVVIASLRETRSILTEQLKKFGLGKYVDDIFIIMQSPFGKDQDMMKKTLIKRILTKYKLRPEECVIVGDTLADIRGGKQSGIRTVGVTTGLCGRKLLEKERPDRIINEISKITKIIE